MPFSIDWKHAIDRASPDENGHFAIYGFGGEGILAGPGATYLLSEWISTGEARAEREAFRKRYYSSENEKLSKN